MSLDADTGAGDCQEWRTLWTDEAFWHLLFAVDIVLVMIICRPTYKHDRYTYMYTGTPHRHIGTSTSMTGTPTCTQVHLTNT